MHLSELNNTQDNSKYSTLGEKILSDTGDEIRKFFDVEYSELQLKILDIMCGNGTSSSFVYDKIQNKISKWIMTDLFDWKKETLPEIFEFKQLNSVASVEEFGCDSNVLLLISPPPASYYDKIEANVGFGDFFACKDFIEQTFKNHNSDSNSKFIIFVGELGASDGTEGMYKYLTENDCLTLVHRKMLSQRRDMFGGACEKELFIFEIKSSYTE